MTLLWSQKCDNALLYRVGSVRIIYYMCGMYISDIHAWSTTKGQTEGQTAHYLIYFRPLGIWGTGDNSSEEVVRLVLGERRLEADVLRKLLFVVLQKVHGASKASNCPRPLEHPAAHAAAPPGRRARMQQLRPAAGARLPPPSSSTSACWSGQAIAPAPTPPRTQQPRPAAGARLPALPPPSISTSARWPGQAIAPTPSTPPRTQQLHPAAGARLPPPSSSASAHWSGQAIAPAGPASPRRARSSSSSRPPRIARSSSAQEAGARLPSPSSRPCPSGPI